MTIWRDKDETVLLLRSKPRMSWLYFIPFLLCLVLGISILGVFIFWYLPLSWSTIQDTCQVGHCQWSKSSNLVKYSIYLEINETTYYNSVEEIITPYENRTLFCTTVKYVTCYFSLESMDMLTIYSADIVKSPIATMSILAVLSVFVCFASVTYCLVKYQNSKMVVSK